MLKRLLIIFALGFSSGLPLTLIGSTLQAWYASEGMSIMATGLISLISFPYVCRMLWAPFVDRYTLFTVGKRRSWIIVTQMLLFICFNWLAWVSPTTHPSAMAAIALLSAFFSATQDIAIDAHRTEYLPLQEQGLGASLAILGYRIALLVTGGVALIMAQKLGWEVTYHLMSSLLLVGLIAAILSPEPSMPLASSSQSKNEYLAPIKELFKRKGIIPLLCFILFYKLAESFTTTTSGIVMPFLIQGMGFSLETIGYVNKIMGLGAIILGGLLAGLTLLRVSLFKSLLFFGLVQAFCNLLFVALTFAGKHIILLSLAVFFDNFAAGMGTTAILALIMRTIDRRFTGTQFSILVAFAALPRVFSGPLGAYLQSFLGWTGLYEVSFVLALGYIPFLFLIQGATLYSLKQEPEPTENLT